MLPLLTCRSVVSIARSWTAIESVDLLTNGEERGVTNGMTPPTMPGARCKTKLCGTGKYPGGMAPFWL